MRPILGILSIMLALTLAVTTVALSGHLSSHKATGTEVCSLCLHAAGSGNALVSEASTFPVIPLVDRPSQPYISPCIQPVALYDNSSRAPPSIV